MLEVGCVLYKAVIVHIEKMEDDSGILAVICLIVPVITIPARGKFVLVYLAVTSIDNICAGGDDLKKLVYYIYRIFLRLIYAQQH